MHVQCLLRPHRGESGAPLILYSDEVLPLFVFVKTISLTIVVTITLRRLQETNAVCLPCIFVTSTTEGKQEADRKCLNCPPVSGLRKCYQF